VVAFAKRLGLDSEAHQLNECLDNTYDGDRAMTAIAENNVNEKAAA
jgi:ferritin-like metal-binding protein YciE